MKKVLVTTYWWPPAGGPGVQRIMRFCKYLREFGWEPVVLTVRNADYPVRDESLEKELPEDITVYKTYIPEPYFLFKKFMGMKEGQSFDKAVLFEQEKGKSRKKRIAEFIKQNIFIPDAKMGWIPIAVCKGLEIIRKENIDLIFSTSPPYTTAVISMLVSMITGTKWIMDTRDPWAGYQEEESMAFVSGLIAQKMESSIFNKCTRMTAAWPGIIDIFHGKYPWVDKGKATWIPNGYDFYEIPAMDKNQNKRFTLTYSGSFYARRYPKTFVENLGQILSENKNIKDRFLLRIIGRIDDSVAGELKQHLAVDNLEIISYMPHKDLLAKLFETDGLWLVMDDVPEANYIVAGKTYEYIGLKKPVLACLPPDTMSEKLLLSTGVGINVPGQDKELLETTLSDWIKKWEAGEQIMEYNNNKIKKFHRRDLTRRLANLFEEVYNENN